MPANLPPQYFEAEKLYRSAKGAEEKIEALENMLAMMPKHKGTDKLRADLRRKIAQFSKEAERKYGGGRRANLYNIRREGAGQIVLVGLPNSGKSALLSLLTDATPDIAAYPFTTKMPTSGMMPFRDIQIQLVDTPAITGHDARLWMSNLLRNTDLLLLMVDLSDNPVLQADTITQQLCQRRIRLPFDEEREIELGEVHKKAFLLGSKCDLDVSGVSYQGLTLRYGSSIPIYRISTNISIMKQGETILEELKQAIYDSLDIIRVYTKMPGQEPDINDPLVLSKGNTIEDAAESIHKDLRNRFKYALVWGSGKYEGQRVRRDHILQDGDIIEVHA